MPTVEQLVFAQHFPFTEAARRIVTDQKVSLDKLPPDVVQRAELMVEHAVSGKKYVFNVKNSELLLKEILAFPVAKILVSFAEDHSLYAKFAGLFSDAALNYLNNAKDTKEEAVALASELGLNIDFVSESGNMISVKLLDFLKVRFSDQMLKLVNQSVSNGKVFLDINGFTRFLRAVVFEKIITSLPVQVSGLPTNLNSKASAFKHEVKEKQRKRFEFAFKGKTDANAFPPCIASMYSELLEGKNIPHMARFILASFLNRIGMPKEQIMLLFKKAPNFNERITRYQVDRLVKQNYTPASCAKIRSYTYCPNTDCKVKHPLSYYERAMKKLKGKEGK